VAVVVVGGVAVEAERGCRIGVGARCSFMISSLSARARALQSSTRDATAIKLKRLAFIDGLLRWVPCLEGLV
jgi:hypothetical protein